MNDVADVSVVLAVRNGGADLLRAVETVLAQSFGNLELIIIDDGSTDGATNAVERIADPRLRVYHQAGAGLSASLNRGISLARGRYIARQDHDDLALASRVEKQVSFLDAHPDYALVGTRSEIWVGDLPSGRFLDHPAEDAVLRFELLFDNPFVHSSVMIRRSALDDVGPYSTDPARQPPEDYELWSRIARKYRVANLPERLTIYREVPGSISRASAAPFREKLVLICAENLAFATGHSAPDPIHFEIARFFHPGPGGRVTPSDAGSACRVLDQAARSIAGGKMAREIEVRLDRLKGEIRHHGRMQKPIFRRAWTAASRVKRGLSRFGLLGRP
ncbi:MAG: glycosyltransferase [Xanthobacteraceae bacterium]|nr:glycosyltransferase [Xanthobacteraceae bacterium]